MKETSTPNYERWKRSRELALERGKFVVSLIEREIKCKELTILDMGSGQGGTANILSEKNNVFSLDIDLERLNSQKDIDHELFRINGNALQVPLKNNSFDLIILQDVIEHLPDPEKIISVLHGLLKTNGALYLSTPNKHSIFNFLADPHWGLPLVSILKKETIRKLFLKNFRKTEFNRKDIAQLLALNDLQKLFVNKFIFHLNTLYSTKELFNGNKGIVWSNFHINILSFLKTVKLNKPIIKISNDKPGIINKFITPTFYFLLKKL